VVVHVVPDVKVADGKQDEVYAEFQRQYPMYAAEHGLVIAAREEDGEVLIRLNFTEPGEDSGIFMIDSVATYYGQEDMEDARACLHCTPAELVADGLMNVSRAAAVVVEYRPVAAAELLARQEPEPIAEAPAVVEPQPRVRTVGAVGYGGIASVLLGVAGTIAGAVDLNRGEVRQTNLIIDYRPRGRALAGVGIGLMAVGTVLLGVDLGLLLPRREAKARARLDGVSVTSMNGPGLVFSGRF